MKNKIIGFFKSLYLRGALLLHPLAVGLWWVLRACNVLLSLGVVGVLVYGFGFDPEQTIVTATPFVSWVFALFFAEYAIQFVVEIVERRLPKVWWVKLITFFVLTFVLVAVLLSEGVVARFKLLQWASHAYLLFGIVVVQAVVNLSSFITQSLHSRFNSQVIFVGSFALLVLMGAGLLMLPRATTAPISFVDALFTSVSAVCVTGMTTVDIVTTFTPVGKVIICLLIQLGGLGIMTFTSFFGLFFAGKHLSQNKMFIKDLIDPEKGVSQIFKTLWYIILVTFSVELIGAYCIFVSIDGQSWNDVAFALFHSISAFCNAGISTVENGLFNVVYVQNYALQMIIAVLVIVGGLGFPIIFNLMRVLLHMLRNAFRRLFGMQRQQLHKSHLMTSNTLIVIVVTAILLIGGTLVFYMTEYHNLLEGRSTWGKLATAFFMSVTPRTAGFCTFDLSQLMPITILWMMLLMWIGASPMSTGGGVKTTTIGIAFLNIWHTLRGRDHIEIRNRRISDTTVNKAFMLIFMSLLMIVVGVLTLSYLEPAVPFNKILLEVFSAVSTAGMSMDLTHTLSRESHVVLLVLMFVGRVGLISVLGCFVKPKRYLNYQYPSESIPIN